ncbi:uncharacterized protein LOC110698622 [Chenopodium quinoa]|nr:uncharacterized protein LOC110698622 [Chenopodium quinoa]XP_021731781.1 uncharacterized protein LOC110698622 [Chenopodium quinoa]
MIPEGVYVSYVHCFLFYYESSTDDYKIFGGFSSFEGDYDQLYVFSLSAGNWRQINVLDNLVVSDEVEEVVLVNETIYMLFEFRNTIIGFDLSTEQIKELQRMNWLNNYRCVSLSELGGCLLLLCTTANLKVDDVWMLKDPSDVSSLEKLFSVNLTNVLYYGFSENGKRLLHTEGKIRVFDPTRETPQMTQGGIAFYNDDSIVQSKSYIESLISPF